MLCRRLQEFREVAKGSKIEKARTAAAEGDTQLAELKRFLQINPEKDADDEMRTIQAERAAQLIEDALDSDVVRPGGSRCGSSMRSIFPGDDPADTSVNREQKLAFYCDELRKQAWSDAIPGGTEYLFDASPEDIQNAVRASADVIGDNELSAAKILRALASAENEPLPDRRAVVRALMLARESVVSGDIGVVLDACMKARKLVSQRRAGVCTIMVRMLALGAIASITSVVVLNMMDVLDTDLGFPAFEMPSFQMPSFEMPSFEMPSF